jgi:hypothetical protein
MEYTYTPKAFLAVLKIPHYEWHSVEQAASFAYLRSTVTKYARSWIRKPNGAFIQLSVWRNRNISKRTKLRNFNTNVKSVLLYACETWKVTQQITNRIQVFINRCLRRITNTRRPETVSNEDLRKRPKQQPIAIQIKWRKWSWNGHTLKKPTGSIKKLALDWNPQETRRRDRPKKTWKRAVEEEGMKVGKTWSEIKRTGVERIRRKRFIDALRSRGSNRN